MTTTTNVTSSEWPPTINTIGTCIRDVVKRGFLPEVYCSKADFDAMVLRETELGTPPDYLSSLQQYRIMGIYMRVDSKLAVGAMKIISKQGKEDNPEMVVNLTRAT